MRIYKTVLVAAGFAISASASAVDFGVMETADVVHPGDFKFIAFPLAVRNSPLREQDSGVAVGAGYGLPHDLDLEVQAAVYDDISYFGSDLEYTFLTGHPLEMSIAGGGHFARSDFGDPWGLDLTEVNSYALPRLPSLKLNAALDLAYERASQQFADAIGTDRRYWAAYAVPGVQWRATHNVDVIGEAGLGLNGDSDDYVSAGISYYFARTHSPNRVASNDSPSSRTK